MKNKIIKKFNFILPYLFLFSRVYAQQSTGNGGTGVTLGAEGAGAIATVIGDIISILFWIACFICTLKIVHIGILYTLTGVDGKSKAKGALLPWLIGLVICVGFTWIGPVIMNLFYTGKGVLEY